MHEELWEKMELQHTTTVWYNGSCTNKHDKLIDTSIQVLSNAKYSASFTDVPYQAGMVNHATINEMVKITDTIFIWHVCCIQRRRQIKNYTFDPKGAMYLG